MGAHAEHFVRQVTATVSNSSNGEEDAETEAPTATLRPLHLYFGFYDERISI